VAAFVLSISAFLLMAGPHYFLPLEFLEGAAGARITLDCDWYYHPEIYIGLLILAAALGSLKSGKFLWLGVIAGLLAILQAILLQPVSHYLGGENYILVLAERTVLRAHSGIRLFLTLTGACVIAVSLIFRNQRTFLSAGRVGIMHLSIRNLGRRRFRSASLALAIAIATGSVFAYSLLMATVESTLEIGAGRLGADIMIVPEGYESTANRVLLSGEPSLFYMPAGNIEGVRRVKGVDAVSAQVYLRPLSYTVCCSAEKILIVGYDPESDFTVAPWIQYVLKAKPGGNEMVVGNGVKYYPGQSVFMFDENFRITGTLERTGLGYFDNSGFIRMDDAYRVVSALGNVKQVVTQKDREGLADLSFTHLTPEGYGEKVRLPGPDEVSAIFVKVAPGVSVAEVAGRLKANLSGVDVISVKASTRSAKEHITTVLGGFIFPVVVIWLMCVAMVAAVFSMSVNERLREIGVLRAMGAARRQIAKLFLSEASVLSALGGILGLELGVSIVLAFMEHMLSDLKLMYIWPSARSISLLVAAVLVMAVASGLLAALYPSFRSSRLEPYAAIRQGE